METSSLETRFRKLERQVVRQRRMLAVTICALFGMIFYASMERARAADDEIPGVVKARAFHVVSDGGDVVVEIDAIGNKGSVVTYDHNKQTQIALGSGEEGGGYITCFNKKGDIQVNLGGDEGGGQVITHGASGVPRVLLSGDDDGGAVLTFDKEGTPRKLQ